MTTDKDWPDCDDTVSTPRPKGMSIHEKLIRYGQVEITLDMLDTPEFQAITTELIIAAIEAIVKERSNGK